MSGGSIDVLLMARVMVRRVVPGSGISGNYNYGSGAGYGGVGGHRLPVLLVRVARLMVRLSQCRWTLGSGGGNNGSSGGFWFRRSV